jgi:hypothetical protein
VRFQSNNILSGAVDLGGPFLTEIVTAAASTNAAMLTAPAANTGWRIRLATVNAFTTVSSVGNAIIQTLGTGTTLLGSYSQANGIFVTQSMDILITEGVLLHNTTAVIASGNIVYRSELLP